MNLIIFLFILVHMSHVIFFFHQQIALPGNKGHKFLQYENVHKQLYVTHKLK